MNTEEYLNKDLYKILKLEKTATFDEIKIAYRNLMRIYHPDINNSEESKKIFNEIRTAYDILSNPKKRELYDIKHGTNFSNDEKNEKTDNEISHEEKPVSENRTKKFMKSLTEIIEGIFVSPPKSGNKEFKGEDICADVTISPKEAVFGTTRIINIMQTKLCPNCEGKKFINDAICPLCKGSGEISTHKKITANIPSNIKNNAKIKIEGAGNQGQNGNIAGDLYLIINIDEKSLFTVKDNVVYMDLPITPYEAVLGANIEIPTFYENVTIKIPPNTSSGQRFRLKGQGIYQKDLRENSDMIVTVVIKIPKILSQKEIEIYKSLEENNTCNIREGLYNND